ncbi:hypothetical protein HGRIS_011539 [Hohenbuehelia grisea]|uniref:RRM domain-containing protein n=1 Tax=Hohenbuehelia grisea TaxID=104357 RepID=A0ABR3JXK2_9AGAR
MSFLIVWLRTSPLIVRHDFQLPYRVRWQDLKDLFRKAGTVLRADVSLGPDNRSRGYGTVLLATAEDAGRAVDMYNGYEWQTRVLEVRPDRLPAAPPTNSMPSMSQPVPPGTHPILNSVAASSATISAPLLRAHHSEFTGSSLGGGAREHDDLDFRDLHHDSLQLLHARSLSHSHFDTHLQTQLDHSGSRPSTSGGLSLASGASASLGAASANAFPNNPPNRTLFVGNLPFHVQWQDLKDLFRIVGPVVRADVALAADGRSRGFGTVVLRSEEDAERARLAYDGHEFNGRTLKVHFDKFTQPQSHLQLPGTSSPFAPSSSASSPYPAYQSASAYPSLSASAFASSSAYSSSSTSPYPSAVASPYSPSFASSPLAATPFSNTSTVSAILAAQQQQQSHQGSSSATSTAVSPSPTRPQQLSVSSVSGPGGTASPFAFSPLSQQVFASQSQSNSRPGSRPAAHSQQPHQLYGASSSSASAPVSIVASSSTSTASSAATTPANLSAAAVRSKHGRSHSQTQPHLLGHVSGSSSGSGQSPKLGMGQSSALGKTLGIGQLEQGQTAEHGMRGTTWDVQASSGHTASYPSMRFAGPLARDERDRELFKDALRDKEREAMRERDSLRERERGLLRERESLEAIREYEYLKTLAAQKGGSTGDEVEPSLRDFLRAYSGSSLSSANSGLLTSASGSSGASILDRLPRSTSGLGSSTSLASRLAYETQFHDDNLRAEYGQRDRDRDGQLEEVRARRGSLGSGYERKGGFGSSYDHKENHSGGYERRPSQDSAYVREDRGEEQGQGGYEHDEADWARRRFESGRAWSGEGAWARDVARAREEDTEAQHPGFIDNLLQELALSKEADDTRLGESRTSSAAAEARQSYRDVRQDTSSAEAAKIASKDSERLAPHINAPRPTAVTAHSGSSGSNASGISGLGKVSSTPASLWSPASTTASRSASVAATSCTSEPMWSPPHLHASGGEDDSGKGLADEHVKLESGGDVRAQSECPEPNEGGDGDQEMHKRRTFSESAHCRPDIPAPSQLKHSLSQPGVDKTAPVDTSSTDQEGDNNDKEFPQDEEKSPAASQSPPGEQGPLQRQSSGAVRSPRTSRAARMAAQAQAQQQAQHPHHPGPIALPPPPHVTAFPLAQGQNVPLSPHGPMGVQMMMPMGSPGHYPGHSPMYHPAGGNGNGSHTTPTASNPTGAHGYVGGNGHNGGGHFAAGMHPHGMMNVTPHGLPPITPSMPPFTFLPQPPMMHPTADPISPGVLYGAPPMGMHHGMMGMVPASPSHGVFTPTTLGPSSPHHHPHFAQQQQQQQQAHVHFMQGVHPSPGPVPPHHMLSTFSPGVAMSPGTVYAGGNPHINAAVGAPVHMFGQPSPGHPGAPGGFFYPPLSSLSPGDAMGGAEPAGYFDTVYLPPMPMYGGMSGLGPGGPGSSSLGAGGVESEIMRDKVEEGPEQEGEGGEGDEGAGVEAESTGGSARTHSMSGKRPLAPTLVHRAGSDPAPKTPGAGVPPQPSHAQTLPLETDHEAVFVADPPSS